MNKETAILAKRPGNHTRLYIQLAGIALLIFLSGFACGGIAFAATGQAAPEEALRASPEGLQQVPYIQSVAEDESWALILVNRENPIPRDYAPNLEEVGDGHYFDTRAADALRDMLSAAEAEGLSPVICSAYRSVETQSELYQDRVRRFEEEGWDAVTARVKAAAVVAYPGTSEHHLGLAVDIVDEGYQNLDEQQANTAVQQWLMENCYQYGFILRYPQDKQSYTGIVYEPWHYRYVGVEAATEIMSKGITLEEYLQETACL